MGGARVRGVVRIGATVRRPLSPRASFTHAVLRHLEQAGFDGAPRLLGIDGSGREILGFVEGVSGPAHHSTRCLDDRCIADAAAMLRRFHDATAGSALAGACEVVCHNDWNPTNAVYRGAELVAMLDFDDAAPGARLADLGYTAFQWLDLGYPHISAAEQCRRIGVLAEGYGGSFGAAAIADHALERQADFARALEPQGKADLARWVWQCRDWTATHVAAPLRARRHDGALTAPAAGCEERRPSLTGPTS